MTQFAIVQMRALPLDPAANLKTVLARLDQTAAQGAELAVFPECALTGYFLTSQEAASMAETIPGPRTERLAEACQSLGIHAVVGTIEKDASGRCYNTAVLVGPEGLLGRYRKSHLICLGVDRFLTPGDSPPAVYDTPLGRLGVLICYDLRFPEPARVLALSGAQAILLPTAWPAAATLHPDFIARTRAAENGVTILAADHVGEEQGRRYLGRSLAVGPDGEVLAEAGREEETILTVEVDLARSLHKHRIFIPGEYEIDLFDDRRPELYSQITTLRE